MQLSRSPKTARDYVKDLEQTMQALNYFPERYRKTPSGKYRRVNFKKYAIFYFIENDTVHIIDVILASSNTVFKY
ncbi:type II toxin-antitoxin system RelE/ParE family toxin [Lactobacillus crispatus]|uniref:type II toxin-antitoxin system RelE/ParE family toxin n=1 Tax=Lactobacillus crispatus TaxID=47770 RepID=UPI001E33BEB7|nr:type II toxin-antitoxin system RelE/ParE family toxin [Lactobacillus crispatus]